MERIYLDHAATTPLSIAARAAMAEWADCGNPSSLYQEGRRAKDVIDRARETVSDALGCLFAEVVFTSGGTEAANLGVVGVALQNEDPRRNRILLGSAEHHCVLHTRPILERLGYRVELIPVDREARVSDCPVFDEDVLLVSVMHANNELGSMNDLASIGRFAHSAGALFHVDAVQTFLKPEVWEPIREADLVSVSAHKINGPKGVGALYTKAGVKLKPLIAGGGQEREVRGGTENVAAVAGFGAAVREHVDRPRTVLAGLREGFLKRLEALGAVRTVRNGPVLKGHVHVRFPGVSAETLLIALDRLGVTASSGAACSSGAIEPSHVLLAAGYSATEAREGVRFTLGPETTVAELDEAANRIERAISFSGPS